MKHEGSVSCVTCDGRALTTWKWGRMSTFKNTHTHTYTHTHKGCHQLTGLTSGRGGDTHPRSLLLELGATAEQGGAVTPRAAAGVGEAAAKAGAGAGSTAIG